MQIEEIVPEALLHDVGEIIPAAANMSKLVDENGNYTGTAKHEVLGEVYLRQLPFSDKICQLVGAYVIAEKYLTALDKDCCDGSSHTSKAALKYRVRNELQS